MGFLSFIGKLLGLGRRFNGTPEQYLAMIQYMAHKNNADYSKAELLQWGEIMKKMMKVDLKPYKSFLDLVENGKADDTLVTQVDRKYEQLKQRNTLKKAIYGDNADLGDDDVMKSNSENAVFARRFVKDLSKHVDFPDDQSTSDIL